MGIASAIKSATSDAVDGLGAMGAVFLGTAMLGAAVLIVVWQVPEGRAALKGAVKVASHL